MTETTIDNELFLKVETKYLMEVQNRCNFKGQYYGEDDWTFDVFGDTIDQCIATFFCDINNFMHGPDIEYVQFFKAKFVTYDGKHHILDKHFIQRDKVHEESKIMNNEHWITILLNNWKDTYKEYSKNKDITKAENLINTLKLEMLEL